MSLRIAELIALSLRAAGDRRLHARAPDRAPPRDAGHDRRWASWCGSLAMARADRTPQTRTSRDAGPADALWLGIAQACALLPGVSRNGATLAAARLARVHPGGRQQALAPRRAAGHRRRDGAQDASAWPGAACRRAARCPSRSAPGASFASTLGSTWLIRQVERDRSLLPVRRVPAAGLAAVVLRPACATAGGVRSIYDNGIVTDAYAAAGVDTRQADRGRRRARRGAAARSSPGASALSVPLPGHYASVIRIAPDLGVAPGHRQRRLQGDRRRAGPALRHDRDRLRGDERQRPHLRRRRAAGAARLPRGRARRPEPAGASWPRACAPAPRTPGVEIPGGEVCQLPEVIRGHPSPYGFDLVGSAFGTVALDAIVDGTRVRPRRRADRAAGVGRALQRPDAGAARAARRRRPGARRAAGRAGRRERRRRAARADRDLRARGARAAALARSPSTGWPTSPAAACSTCCGSATASASRSPSRCRCPPVFSLIAELGDVPAAEMWEVFNMGCGFCAWCRPRTPTRAVALLGGPSPRDRGDRPRHRRRRPRRASPAWASRARAGGSGRSDVPWPAP